MFDQDLPLPFDYHKTKVDQDLPSTPHCLVVVFQNHPFHCHVPSGRKIMRSQANDGDGQNGEIVLQHSFY